MKTFHCLFNQMFSDVSADSLNWMPSELHFSSLPYRLLFRDCKFPLGDDIPQRAFGQIRTHAAASLHVPPDVTAEQNHRENSLCFNAMEKSNIF